MNATERTFEAFKALCDFMNASDLRYEVPDGKNVAFVTIKGEQFPVTLMFAANESTERLETYCQFPFTIEEEYVLPYVEAVNAVNMMLPMGKFCIYPSEGICAFESSEYLSGLSGFSEAYGRMIVAGAYSMVQEYISPLYEVACGRMTAAQFAEIVAKKRREKERKEA